MRQARSGAFFFFVERLWECSASPFPLPGDPREHGTGVVAELVVAAVPPFPRGVFHAVAWTAMAKHVLCVCHFSPSPFPGFLPLKLQPRIRLQRD